MIPHMKLPSIPLILQIFQIRLILLLFPHRMTPVRLHAGLVVMAVAVVMVDLQGKILTDPLNRPRQIFAGCIFGLSEDIFDHHHKIWFRHVVLFDVFLPDAAEFDLISVRESLWFSVFFLCLNCLIDFPNKWFFEFYPEF